MTFLNPAILWALAAVSIPIIIHIFNLKKTKKIEFSTLMFLKEIQQSKYKKIKLKQLLILLCRIAFVILLVLMFARPFSKGFLGTSGEKARSSVLIILDDSFSMQSRETSGNSFENAKAKISETLNILDPNDEVFFTTVSQINRLDKNLLYKDLNSLRDTLNTLKTSDVTKSMNEVLFFAKEILKSASHSYKEVYIFTDGQKSFIENANLINDGLKPDEQTNLNYVLIGSRTPNNLSVDTINTVTKIFEKNKPVKIKASLNNHNNFNVLNKSVVINFGNYKDEKAIDIPANSTVDVEFIISAGVTGYAGGFIELVQNEISDDEISSDNRQFFSFFIPQKVSLLLVSTSPTDLQYINLALSSSEELMKDSLGNRTKYFEIKQVSSNELMSQNLNSFNSVVIANKPQFTQTESHKLKEHIESGGGVIIYPGSISSPESYNNMMRELDLPLINGSFGNDNPAYKFDKIDFEHPIFEGIFKQSSNQKNVSVESPGIKSGLNLSTGQNAISLITLNNEKNFLVEYSKGKGKLILFAVSPDMSNSDYPAKNLFSPITVRSILYLANINNIKPAITGKDYFIDVKTLSSTGDTISISHSTDSKLTNKIYVLGTDILLNLKNNTNFTANYTISQDNKVLFQFPANFSKAEPETIKLDGKALEAYLKERLNIEANVIKPQETISASILELRTGKDIWQYFLIAALLFIIIEYFLARSLIKNK
jgi:glutaredoxin-related protein